MTHFLKAAALILAVAITNPATAAIVQVTYTGTIYDAEDISGVFGPAGGNLNGAAFQSVMIFDTALGTTVTSPTFNHARGGLVNSTASPALSATVTINGVSVSFAGDYDGQTLGATFGGFGSSQAHDAEHFVDDGVYTTWNRLWQTVYNDIDTLPATIDRSFTHVVTADDYTFGYFQIYYIKNFSNSYFDYAYGFVNFDTLTVVRLSPGGVPEPANWLMMIAGFGLVGTALRRRQSTVAAATALL